MLIPPLNGGKGDDIITGAGGGDALIGNQGDDTYYISGDWGTDSIIEARKEGSDTISFAGLETQTSPDVAAIAAISDDLTIAISSAGLIATEDSNVLNVAADSFPYVENVIGGTGNNTYSFADNWGRRYGKR